LCCCVATSCSCCIFLLRCCECNCAFFLQFSALHFLLYCQSHCTTHRAPLYAFFMSIAQRRKRPCRCFVAIVLRLAQISAAPQNFHERVALTIDKRRARSSCCETFLPLAPCVFFTATKSLLCSSCCGVVLNFISSTAVPIFTDDFGQHPHHSPPCTKHSHKCTPLLSRLLQPVTN
jgi:hypothetical protein